MASFDNNNDKSGKGEEERQIAAGSGTRRPTFARATNPGRAFSHDIQGPVPPVPDSHSFPTAGEALQVTNEFCDQYRVLRKEVEILRKGNARLRRMLENLLAPIMITPPSPKE